MITGRSVTGNRLVPLPRLAWLGGLDDENARQIPSGVRRLHLRFTPSLFAQLRLSEGY